MQEKPRVGLVLMRSAYPGCGRVEELRQQVQASTDSIVAHLSKRFAILGPWVVDSPESLAVYHKSVSQDPPDMLLLAFQTYIDESLLVALLEGLRGMPLVLWCYLPFRRFPHPATYLDIVRSSGSVTALTALGTLRNLRLPFLFTWGAVEDPGLLHDLEVAGRAAQLSSALDGARFGILPERRADLQSQLANEARVQQDLGPKTEIISIADYCAAAEAITDEQVRESLSRLWQNYRVESVPAEVLADAARSSLALSALAQERDLDVLAINLISGAWNSVPGLRPGLYPDAAVQSANRPRILYLAEDDLGAAVASYILHRLTGSPTMLLEFWYWDEALNQMVGGHAGPQDPEMGVDGQAWISREADICRGEEGLGAQFELVARPGRVTIFQLRATPVGWQAIAATGVALDTRPVVSGLAHVLLRLDVPIEAFLNNLSDIGAAQHWVMAYGSVLDEIEAFCQMENIPLLKLRY